jgi:hypothetical protein
MDGIAIPKLLFVSIWTIPKVCLELRSTFVQGHRMSEGADDRIRSSKRKSARDESHRIDGIPDTNELNINVDGKGGFECIGLLPANLIRTCVHLVGEWNLLEIARR